MEVDADDTHDMLMMKMMIMLMMMIIAVTQSILKLGPPDFAWN